MSIICEVSCHRSFFTFYGLLLKLSRLNGKEALPYLNFVARIKKFFLVYIFLLCIHHVLIGVHQSQICTLLQSIGAKFSSSFNVHANRGRARSNLGEGVYPF